MSFILDALKKADRQRKRGEVPELLEVHDAEITHPKRSPWWPYLVISFLIVNTGAFVWWLKPWETGQQGVIPSPLPVVQNEKERTTGSQASKRKPVATKTQKRIKKQTVSTGADIPEGDRMQGRMIFTPLKTDGPAHAAPEPTVLSRKTKPDNKRIYNTEELPQSVQKNLPELIITVHLYSDDPSARMINTYGKTVREGQTVTDDLKLEEIAPDSVIFSYKGYKFRKNLF